MSLEPSLVLSVLIGIFHTALYVAIRGSAGGRLPLLLGAAILGAWAGDAIFGRLGIEVLDDRRLPGARRVDRGLGRHRARLGRGGARPVRGAADVNAPERARFLRGLTIGALIGAIIAGSRIWARIRSGGR